MSGANAGENNSIPEAKHPSDSTRSSDNTKQNDAVDKTSSQLRSDVGGADRLELNKRTNEDRDPEKRLSKKTAGRGTYGECEIDDFKLCGKNKDTIVHLNNGLPEKIETANQVWQRDEKNSQVWHVQEGDKQFDLKADVRLKGDNVFATAKYENGTELTFKNGNPTEMKTADGQQKIKGEHVDTETGAIISPEPANAKPESARTEHAEPELSSDFSKGDQVIFKEPDPRSTEIVAHEISHVIQKDSTRSKLTADSPSVQVAQPAEHPPMPQPHLPTPQHFDMPKPLPPSMAEHVPMPQPHLPTPHIELPRPLPMPAPVAEHAPLPPEHLRAAKHIEVAIPKAPELTRGLSDNLSPKFEMPKPIEIQNSPEQRQAEPMAQAVALLPKATLNSVSIPALPSSVQTEKSTASALPVLRPSILVSGSTEGMSSFKPMAPKPIEYSPSAPAPIDASSGKSATPGPMVIENYQKNAEKHQAPEPRKAPVHADATDPSVLKGISAGKSEAEKVSYVNAGESFKIGGKEYSADQLVAQLPGQSVTVSDAGGATQSKTDARGIPRTGHDFVPGSQGGFAIGNRSYLKRDDGSLDKFVNGTYVGTAIDSSTGKAYKLPNRQFEYKPDSNGDVHELDSHKISFSKPGEQTAQAAQSQRDNKPNIRNPAKDQILSSDQHVNKSAGQTGSDGIFHLGTAEQVQLAESRAPISEHKYTPKMFGVAADGSQYELQGNIDQQAQQARRGADAHLEAQRSLIGGGALDQNNSFEITPGLLAAGANEGHQVVINIYNNASQTYTGSAFGHLVGSPGADSRTLVIDSPQQWKNKRYALQKI